MRSLNVIGLCIALVSVSATAAEAPKLDTAKQRYSYAIGYRFGMSATRDGLDLAPKAAAAALNDALTGNTPQLDAQQMNTAMRDLQTLMAKVRQQTGEKSQNEGKAFLKRNAKKEGVVTRPSGLQYKVISTGSGSKPSPTDTVSVHYRGRLIDGTEFDSSYRRNQPTTFPVNGVIRGWQEALPLMSEGAEWQLVIPSELAYGERGAPPNIAPNAVLIFDIKLIKIQ